MGKEGGQKVIYFVIGIIQFSCDGNFICSSLITTATIPFEVELASAFLVQNSSVKKMRKMINNLTVFFLFLFENSEIAICFEASAPIIKER